jgi:hypothetical protein
MGGTAAPMVDPSAVLLRAWQKSTGRQMMDLEIPGRKWQCHGTVP